MWTGNAADRARDYLNVLGRAIEARRAQYEHVAKAYGDLAEQAWAIFDAAGYALGMLADKLAAIVIAVAAGTATIETVVGGIIGYGAAGYAAIQATKLVTETIALMARLENSVKVAKAALALTGGGLGNPGLHGPEPTPALALPRAPYDRG